MITPNRKITRWTLSSILALTAIAATTFPGRPALAENPGRQVRPHPKIDEAIGALDDAKDELEHASDDFHGHKKDALRKVEDARRELDRNRTRGGNKEDAVAKLDDAKAELRECEKGGEHPKIHKAIEALDAAKDELE